MKHRVKVVLVLAFCLTMVLGVSFKAYGAPVLVEALYPANGANWNDYVVNDGSDFLTASDIACTGTETGGYSACLHGGELRMIEVKNTYTCAGLTVSDALNAFNWICDESTSPVRMVSTGLKDGKNLSDLLDFGRIEWKTNKVTVNLNGSLLFETKSISWSNPVVVDNDGGYLNDAGTIYVVTDDANTRGYVINSSSVALVGQPGIIINGPGILGYVIMADGSANARDFAWIEGHVDATGYHSGVILNYVKFSVVRNVKAENSDTGVHKAGVFLHYSTNNLLTGITASHNLRGVYIYSSTNNTITDITTTSNYYGLYIHSSSSNTFTEITTSHNSNSGIHLFNNSRYNTLADITASRNYYGVWFRDTSDNTLSRASIMNNHYGVYLTGSSDNTFSRITASANAFQGIYFDVPWSNYLPNNYNTLSGITASNNGHSGAVLYRSSDTFVSGMTASNNQTYGLFLRESSDITVSGFTATHHGGGNAGHGVYLKDSSYNTFTGQLKVGFNSYGGCGVNGGTDPGLLHVSCANQGASDATLTTGVSTADSFVAKVTTDDSINTSDSNGSALFSNIADWTGFENLFRGWGTDGLTFPDPSNRGYCTTGTCRIWDWSAAAGDTVIKDSLAFPTGNDTLLHTWSDFTNTTFLRNAVEITGDEIGNENTLCESNEECLYMPNMGSYQGHGNLISAGPFTDGTITGVTMLMYETNGR